MDALPLSPIDDVIAILRHLGLPEEIGLMIVYKFNGAVHPSALAIINDPYLSRTATTFIRKLQNSYINPGILRLVCSCKNPPPSPQRNIRFALKHRVHKSFHWSTLTRDPDLWLTRIYKCHHVSDNNNNSKEFCYSFVCPYTRLIIRYVLNKTLYKSLHSVEVQNAFSNAIFPNDCYTLGNDDSFTLWWRYAPHDALMEYAKGISGMQKEDICNALAIKLRNNEPSSLISFILNH